MPKVIPVSLMYLPNKFHFTKFPEIPIPLNLKSKGKLSNQV